MSCYMCDEKVHYTCDVCLKISACSSHISACYICNGSCCKSCYVERPRNFKGPMRVAGGYAVGCIDYICLKCNQNLPK